MLSDKFCPYCRKDGQQDAYLCGCGYEYATKLQTRATDWEGVKWFGGSLVWEVVAGFFQVIFRGLHF